MTTTLDEYNTPSEHKTITQSTPTESSRDSFHIPIELIKRDTFIRVKTGGGTGTSNPLVVHTPTLLALIKHP